MYIRAQLSDTAPNYYTDIFFTVVTTLSILLIGWISKRLWDRFHDDKVLLEAKFENSGSLTHIEDHGCTGLVLTLINRGRRTAKIKRAQISAQHVDMLQYMQQGFDQDFGYTPAEGAPPPELLIELIPLSTTTHESGWQIERDDAIQFFLPILAPPVPAFPDLPSEDLRILITYVNGEVIELLRGSKVQEPIKILKDSWKDRLAEQRLKTVVNYNVNVSSSTPPSMEAVGYVNTRAINFSNDISSNPSATRRRRD